jgi:hypothetical protein
MPDLSYIKGKNMVTSFLSMKTSREEKEGSCLIRCGKPWSISIP